MNLILDLKKKTLADDENKFYYSFNEWSFIPKRKDSLYGDFKLDDLVINKGEISTVTFEIEKDVISFQADYDGEGYFSDIMTDSDTEYNEKILLKELDSFLDNYISKNPLTGGEGTITGEVEAYFNYEDEEFVFSMNKLVLEED